VKDALNNPKVTSLALNSRYPFSKFFCSSGFNLLANKPLGITDSSSTPISNFCKSFKALPGWKAAKTSVQSSPA
jgi:hypothetical protein